MPERCGNAVSFERVCGRALARDYPTQVLVMVNFECQEKVLLAR